MVKESHIHHLFLYWFFKEHFFRMFADTDNKVKRVQAAIIISVSINLTNPHKLLKEGKFYCFLELNNPPLLQQWGGKWLHWGVMAVVGFVIDTNVVCFHAHITSLSILGFKKKGWEFLRLGNLESNSTSMLGGRYGGGEMGGSVSEAPLYNFQEEYGSNGHSSRSHQ